jgi:hypothetical protein
MGLTNLRKMQMGAEASTAQGTAVAATSIFRGPADLIVDDVERTMVSENVAFLVQTDRGYFPFRSASLPVRETEATFEQVQYVFEAGLSTAAASANGGTTTAYVYEYPASVTSQLSIRTFTWETGDDQEQYEMEFGYVKDFTITGAPNQAVMIAANWGGRQKTAADFTTALSLPTVEEILFNKCKLYLDAAGGTLGATVRANTFLGFTINFTTGWTPVYTGDGNLYFSFLKNVGPEVTGAFTLEYDAVGEAMEDVFAAGTTYLSRVDCIGSALTGTGGTHATKLLRLDHAIQITSVEMNSQDGNDVITLNWKAVYNVAATLFSNYTVCNLLSAVP